MESSVLLGASRPRFFTSPPRHTAEEDNCRYCDHQADGHAGVGCGDYISQEMLEWAAGYGYELDEWQQWIIREGCGVKPGGRWASFENTLIVSRQNGKGAILEVREMAGLFVLNEELIVHTAHELRTAQEHFLRVVSFLENNPALLKKVQGGKPRRANGQEEIKLRATPTHIFGASRKMVRKSVTPRLKFSARTRGAIRGLSADCLVWDEAMILSAEAVGAALPALSAKGNPQMWLTGSAGLEDSEQLASSRRRIIAGDRTLFGAEWSIKPHLATCPRDRARGRAANDFVTDCEEHDDRDAPESAAKANPAFGIRLFWEQTENELAAMPPVEYDRERLGVGQWPGEDESWKVVSRDLWDSLMVGDPGRIVAGRTQTAFALEVDEDGNSTSVSVAWVHPDGYIVTEIPRNCTRPGTDWAVERLEQLVKKYRPVAIVAPRDGPAAGLGDDLEKLWPKHHKFGSRLIRTGPGDHAAAYAWFVQQCKSDDRPLRHLGKDRASGLWHAVGAAETRVIGDGGKTWSRRDSTSDITPATACNLAAWGLAKKRRNYDLIKSLA